MQELNIIFGIVGVASLLYAVWEHRRARSARELTERITGDIRQLATVVHGLNRGTPTEGYARSIMQVCNSLLADSTSQPQIGRVELEFPAWLMPPLQTNCGEIVDDEEAGYGRAVRGRRINDLRRALVYGPYQALPVTGEYRVRWVLKGVPDDPGADGGDECVSLNVYDHDAREYVAQRRLSARDLQAGYQKYELDFLYQDIRQSLEYRVQLLSPWWTVTCQRVYVRRLSG